MTPEDRERQCAGLHDCDGCVKWCRHIDELKTRISTEIDRANDRISTLNNARSFVRELPESATRARLDEDLSQVIATLVIDAAHLSERDLVATMKLVARGSIEPDRRFNAGSIGSGYPGGGRSR